MNLAFFVSSAINVDDTNEYKFPYAGKRSEFNSEERFRQTQTTINSIRLSAPGSKIFLVDISKNYQIYKERLNYVPNLTFIALEDLDPASAHLCRTNLSKGYCEATLTESFVRNYFNQIKNYDFLVKISGRYFFTGFDKSIFTETNKDKYMFMYLKSWDWSDNWGYPEDLKRNNKLHWAFTVVYGIGQHCFDDFYNCSPRITAYYANNPQYANILDYECAIYYQVLENKNLLETNWCVAGWNGASGKYDEFGFNKF